jgi:pimeloyl-ACP methyl ester carboxylesterase
VFTEQIANEIRKLPHVVWPMIQSHWCDPKCFEGMARYLEALPESAAAVAATDVHNMPLMVLSAGNATTADRAEHQRLARCSLRGRNETVMGSGHWIQLDRPDVLIRAISEMVVQCSS